MSSVVFDAEEGVLRLSHAALSVLARLATDPTDPALLDHAVAEPLAALRAAGVVGRSGLHPAVGPLAEAVGRADITLQLTVADRNTTRVHHGWVAAELTVVAVPAGQSFDLVADRTDALGDLVGDLTGLEAAAWVEETDALMVDAEALDTLIRRGGGARAEDLRALSHGDPPAALTEAAAAFVNALHRQWRLTVHDGDEVRFVEVYDAGSAGLWQAEPAGEQDLTLRRVTAATVRRHVHELAGVETGS